MPDHKPTTLRDRLGALRGLLTISDDDYHAFMGSYGELFVDSPENTLADYEAGIAPKGCLLYTSPSPRDRTRSRMPSSA